MQNKKALRWLNFGIIFQLFQFIMIAIVLANLLYRFSDFTIINHSVTNGQMQSFSFMQMLQAMLYSGEPINYMLFFSFIVLFAYVGITLICLVLELIAYFKIAKGNNVAIWKNVMIVMGIRGIFYDIGCIPLLVGGLSVKEE